MHHFELGGSSPRSIVLRELLAFEHDVVEANVEAFHGAKAAKSDQARSYARVVESVRLSIVEVDGMAVDAGEPYMGLDNWTQKKLSTVISLYAKINGSEDAEVERFLASSRPVSFADLGRGLQSANAATP